MSSIAVVSGHDSSENAHADHKRAVGIRPLFVSNNQVCRELEDEAGLHLSQEKPDHLLFCKVSEDNRAEHFTCAGGVLKLWITRLLKEVVKNELRKIKFE